MIRIGMVGLGVISQFYLPALAASPELRVAAVCDRDPTRRHLAPDCATFHEVYRAVLDDDSVDAVVVNLPNHLHYQVCREALLAGKHVCCEKPLALCPEQAADLTATASAVRRTLFTSFHRRYNRNVLRLRERMKHRSAPRRLWLSYCERIEDHCGTDAWYLDVAKCGGGCLADNGPNAFDTAWHLLGPVRVDTSNVEWRPGDGDRPVDVRASVSLRTESGSAAEVRLDWAYQAGEDKTVTVEWADGHRDHADMLDGYPAFKSSLYHEYVGVLADFAATVSGRHQRVDTGLPVAELVAQAYRQATENQA